MWASTRRPPPGSSVPFAWFLRVSYTCFLVNRTLARLVALFFLCSAAFDICHPCAEKLEAVGLLPDHAGFDWDHPPGRNDSSVAVRQNEGRRQQGKRQNPPVDDDCFCCNGRLLVVAPFLPPKPVSVWIPVENRVPARSLAGFLRYHNYHPPPLPLDPLGTEVRIPDRRFRPLQIVLSGDLSSPPSAFHATGA